MTQGFEARDWKSIAQLVKVGKAGEKGNKGGRTDPRTLLNVELHLPQSEQQLG